VKKIVGVDVRTGEFKYSTENDVRYHCVCVEQTDFRPISLEDVVKRIESEGGEVRMKVKGNGPAM
jgi:predicted rRNA methylase YqxC with S4 and FtsJ domains